MKISRDSRDALLVVDMQNDFLPGGSLAVPGAETLIDQINDYIRIFNNAGLPVFASRDLHPADHVSFVTEGGQWPAHCVVDTIGANFHPDLKLPEDAIIISKGVSTEKDAYSALEETVLHELLQQRNITRVFVCGLATEYCVHASARDLLLAGYTVIVLADAIKAVNVHPGDGDKAIHELTSMGATVITKDSLYS